MAGAAAGDNEAWVALVDAYAPRVHALLFSNCHDHDLSEEITQSTFCTVASKIGTYVEQGKFQAWIFRIAMNRLRDEMRRRKRQAIPVAGEVLTPVAPLRPRGQGKAREDRPGHSQSPLGGRQRSCRG